MSDRKPQSPGMGMLVAGCVLGLAMLTWLMAGFEKQRDNPNQNPSANISSSARGEQYLEVPLQRNQWNQYLVNGYVNGVEVVFLVDTGATRISIPAHMERELRLERGRTGYAQTANGTARTYDTILQHIDLAGITREGMRASIIENMDSDFILLGMNFLSTLDMEQSADTLVLKEAL